MQIPAIHIRHFCRLTIFLLLISLYLAGCAGSAAKQAPPLPAEPVPHHYTVDLTDPVAGTFRVALRLREPVSGNAVFAFAGAGPYAGIDFGEQVRSLAAFDASGREIPVRRIDRRRWLLPGTVQRIEYRIAHTRDLPEARRPLEMLGTVRTPDFAFITGQGVFGVLQGWEKAPLRIRIRTPANWEIGTALPRDPDGDFFAGSFGELASSPILAGYLSHTADRILGSEVRIFAYAATDRITADDLYPLVRNVLTATYHFLDENLPLDRYTMLFMFTDRFAGGVEYHNSAAFVFAEDHLENIRTEVQDIIAHEYFHLVIPFSVRSDAVNIDDYFGARPTAQLWFFEGVTEWASDLIQVRSGLKDMQHFFLEDFRSKVFREEWFGSQTSLYDLSLAARGNPREYANVYSRGALVATLLDIYLLDLTHGRRGLREVINDLILDYGREKPLPEEQFFEILSDYCGPELEDFIRRYIIGNEPLPYREVLEKIGLIYEPERPAGDGRGDLGMVFGANAEQVSVLWVDPAVQGTGVRRGDVVRQINGRDLTPENYSSLMYRDMRPGEPYTLELLREGRRLRVDGRAIPRKIRHTFSMPPMLTPAQQRVRQAWGAQWVIR